MVLCRWDFLSGNFAIPAGGWRRERISRSAMSRYQTLFHGSNTWFRSEEIEPGGDGLIHLHLNPNPIRISYLNIYKVSLLRPLESLPFVLDQGLWEAEGLMWDLKNLSKSLSQDDLSKIDRLGGGYETKTCEALYDILRDKGLVGFRYMNAYEFPGMSVAVFDSSALVTEACDKFHGDSFEADYAEAQESISEEEFSLSPYCASAINHGTIGHWPRYIAELDDLISRIKKSFVEEHYRDPEDEGDVARAIMECNDVGSDTVQEGMVVVAEWRRIHPQGWNEGDSPFSLKAVTPS